MSFVSTGDQVMKNMDFSGPSASSQLLERMSQDATMIKKAGGGMMNINDMIKPLGFEKGGSMNRAELEGLLKSLNISLMLAQETGSFLGGGNAGKIKELENQIKQVQLMLGE